MYFLNLFFIVVIKEWKGCKILFMRGCSFYEFIDEGGILVIR